VTSLVLAVDADPVGRDGSGNETFLRGFISGLDGALNPDDRVILYGANTVAIAEAAAHLEHRVLVRRTRTGLLGQVNWAHDAAKLGANTALGHWNPPLWFHGIRGTVLHDAAVRAVPETFPWPLRRRIDLSMRLASRVSDLIVTDTNFSRAHLLDEFPALHGREVVVASLAPSDAFRLGASEACEHAARVRVSLGLPDQFVLAVGNVQPRKNLPAVVEAARRAGVPVCIAGRARWGKPVSSEPEHVHWLGYVPDYDLPGLYAAATALVYPSLYEGFGLPVVEAMAAGCPVICSATTSVREVAGDAAELVDPTDVGQIAASIRRVLESPAHAKALTDRGRQRAGNFSWVRTSARILDAFRRQLSPP
jgi:alpha-1,3-rhamnosyl/mannosyltransferase